MFMKANVPGIPHIHVTKDGAVYRLDEYTAPNGRVYQRRKGKPKLLPKRIVHKTPNYQVPKVSISIPGFTKQVRVSQLVALAYIPNPENKPCVCHKDNNPENNHVDNLYWGTVQENIEQKVRDGRSNRGWNCLFRTTSDRKKFRVYRYHLRHPEVMGISLALKFGISKAQVHRIIHAKDPVIKIGLNTSCKQLQV